MNKIFGIGLNHTGTRSLHQALEILGIKSIHWAVDHITYRELARGQYNLTILKKYQAISDMPICTFYPQFDRIYPGSKFILTIRDKAKWMASMRKMNNEWLEEIDKNYFDTYIMWFNRYFKENKRTALRATIWRMSCDQRAVEFYRAATYGGLVFKDESRFSFVYDQHHETVFNYFKNRPDDLLVINITEGEGWQKLCPFLSKPIPSTAFPNILSKRHHL